jgi:hypothetical protein
MPPEPKRRRKRTRKDRARDRRRVRLANKYDAHHRALRKRLEPFVASGQAICARCKEPIRRGERWDLDHRDDGQGYLGPSHATCNRQAKGGRRRKSRKW